MGLTILGAFLVPIDLAEAARIVTETTYQSKYETDSVVTFVASPGEANRLTVTGGKPIDPMFSDTPSYVYFRDEGAFVDGGECGQSDPHSASCNYLSGGLGTRTFEAELGDEADVAWAEPRSRTHVDGGEGDDTVTAASANGGTGGDTLTAWPTGGRLSGGPGVDHLLGSPANDVFWGGDLLPMAKRGAAEADLIEGGGGTDTVRYPVYSADSYTVDLPAGRVVQAGSDAVDTLTDVESAATGSGTDLLIGTPGANSLESGPGDDRLVGGDGDDMLKGEDGSDAFEPGAGNDVIDAVDDNLSMEPIRCGPGDDTVSTGRVEGSSGFLGLGVASRDAVGLDCERVTYARFGPVPVLPAGLLGGRRAVVPVQCSLKLKARCTATAALRVDGRVVGQASRTVRAGRVKPVTVPLRQPIQGSILSVSATMRLGKQREVQGYRVLLR